MGVASASQPAEVLVRVLRKHADKRHLLSFCCNHADGPLVADDPESLVNNPYQALPVEEEEGTLLPGITEPVSAGPCGGGSQGRPV